MGIIRPSGVLSTLGIVAGIGVGVAVLASCGGKEKKEFDVGTVDGDAIGAATKHETTRTTRCISPYVEDRGKEIDCERPSTSYTYVRGNGGSTSTLTVDYGWYNKKGFNSAAEAVKYLRSDGAHYSQYMQDSAVVLKRGDKFDVATGHHKLFEAKSAEITDPSVIAVFDRDPTGSSHPVERIWVRPGFEDATD